MSGLVRLSLALLPLAGYFFLLGRWYESRRPKLVAGPLDFGLLAVGLGGLICFGPVGGLIVNAVFPNPGVAGWLAFTSLVGLLAMVGASRSRKRIVVYHVEAEVVTIAVEQAIQAVAGPVTRTLHGFECHKNRRGVRIDTGRRLDYAVIEAYGDRPEELAELLGPALARQLNPIEPRATRLPTLLYGLGCGTLTVLVVVTAILTRPEVRGLLLRISGR